MNRAIVQVAGDAWRLAGTALHAEGQPGGVVHLALLRYTQALLTQVSQTAVCNQLHAIPQRLCLWLLLLCDRAPTDTKLMTHEYLAEMLGIRRASVTTEAHKLQEAGIIQYSRGRLTVLDRSGLEARVCECYQVVQDECARLEGLNG